LHRPQSFHFYAIIKIADGLLQVKKRGASSMNVSILLVDDHAILRQGIATLIEQQKGMKIAGQAEDGRQAIKLAIELKPDIVFMDVSMPDLNGIDATRQILNKVPETKVIALSMHSYRRYIVGMLRAGASGYLVKNCVFEELLTAISMVSNNHIYLSDKIRNLVLKDYILNIKKIDSLKSCPLTAREKIVIQMIAEGSATREIASQLNLSISTVETHLRHIPDKLNASIAAELTKYDIREGLANMEIY
jgi:two-component system response regulator NreC